MGSDRGLHADAPPQRGIGAAGPEWLTPDLYRLGASTLLNDVLMQIRKEKTGRYQSPDYFTVG